MKIKQNLVIVALCLWSGACASLMVDKNTHDYPQVSKDSFMSSCMTNSGGQKEACSCMLMKVQEKYTYGEMNDLEQKIKSGQTPPEFTDFMNKAKDSCMNAGQPSANSK